MGGFPPARSGAAYDASGRRLRGPSRTQLEPRGYVRTSACLLAALTSGLSNATEIAELAQDPANMFAEDERLRCRTDIRRHYRNLRARQG